MIDVIDLGYIGLPTALMLASHGVEVIGAIIPGNMLYDLL
jgi:UDP-N-acetyl-D-mannosaminuronate dehydrogenase